MVASEVDHAGVQRFRQGTRNMGLEGSFEEKCSARLRPWTAICPRSCS